MYKDMQLLINQLLAVTSKHHNDHQQNILTMIHDQNSNLL